MSVICSAKKEAGMTVEAVLELCRYQLDRHLSHSEV